MKVLKLKSTGSEVEKLQEALGLPVDGVFGAKTEEAVKKWQKAHGPIVDGIVGQQTWDSIMGSQSGQVDSSVLYKPINANITNSPYRAIKYLVIHFTAGAKSTSGTAESTRNQFAKSTRKASADFIVDDKTMVQANPDLRNYYCWAVGDGNGPKVITNKNSISIEICSNLEKGTTAKVPNHEGWSFTEDSLNMAIKLAKILMKAYKIDKANVVRHYDATGKLCPGVIGWNKGGTYDKVSGKRIVGGYSDESEWNKFKSRL